MKKASKHLITLILGMMVLLIALPLTSAAADYSVNYWEHSEPAKTLYYTGGTTIKGDDVKWFQCAINNLIINGDVNNSKLNTSKLDVDGSFGPASKTALLAFQKKYSLSQDGKFGPGSRSKMKAMLKEQPVNQEKKYYTVGPASGKVSYYNRSVSYFNYSDVAKQMISSTTGSNGSFYFNLKENDGNQRIGYVYAYNSSKKLIATIQITQQGTYVKAEMVTPKSSLQYAWEGGYCLSSLGGDVVRYKITSNRLVNIRVEDEKGSYLYTTVGKNQFDANTNGTYYVDVKFPNNPTSYNRHLGIAAIAGSKVSRPEQFYQPVNYNRYDAGNSIYPLGSIVYGGYRYKVVTRDDIPKNGYTVVATEEASYSSFDWSEFLGTELEEGNYSNGGGALAGTLIQFIPSMVAGKNNASVELTFYKSAIGLRYAIIEIYDTTIIKQMQKYAGLENPFVDLEDGRKMQMHFDEKHAEWGDRSYDGYINQDGKFCIVFHGLEGDYIRIRETIGWAWNPEFSIVPWYGYGFDNAHKTPFEPMKASNGFNNLLNKALSK